LAICHGANTVTTLVEKKKAQLVIIANDVDPIEASSGTFFPISSMMKTLNESLHLKTTCRSSN